MILTLLIDVPCIIENLCRFMGVIQSFLKETLIKSHKFWQRQISSIKACDLLMLTAFKVNITQRLGIWLSPEG